MIIRDGFRSLETSKIKGIETIVGGFKWFTISTKGFILYV